MFLEAKSIVLVCTADAEVKRFGALRAGLRMRSPLQHCNAKQSDRSTVMASGLGPESRDKDLWLCPPEWLRITREVLSKAMNLRMGDILLKWGYIGKMLTSVFAVKHQTMTSVGDTGKALTFRKCLWKRHIQNRYEG